MMEKGKGCLQAFSMVAVQAGYAGLNVLSKLALDSGTSPLVLIAYRQIVSTLLLAPIAIFLERKAASKITGRILVQIFVSSIFGATLNQLLYFIGLQYTTPTIASALTNVLPAMTFIMALPFRIETADMKTSSGQAKVVGTAFSIGGSMLMTFYKGPLIHVPSSSIHWTYAEGAVESDGATLASRGEEAIGAMLVVASCIAWAAWFIIQAKMSQSFSAPYTNSALFSAMAALQCLLIGIIGERDFNRWALGLDIRLVAVLYIGVVCSGFAVLLMTWAIEKRGPLFVSMFSPVQLMIVAVLGWSILDEKIYLSSALGSVVIVLGLYMVLWGKGRELKAKASLEGDKEPYEGGAAEGKQETNGALAIYSPTANAYPKEKKEGKVDEV
ncbi:WAT1-related protein [Platanthera zijinensis]|uniref:WAT1-related protein n=1 Tax=Platanthera zijinensis TaxID=2320716 RepID=A0AAP0G343_9ASPA